MSIKPQRAEATKRGSRCGYTVERSRIGVEGWEIVDQRARWRMIGGIALRSCADSGWRLAIKG